jgi:hypothetical protein
MMDGNGGDGRLPGDDGREGCNEKKPRPDI